MKDPFGDDRALTRELGVRVIRHGVVDSTMEAAREDAGPPPSIHLAVEQRRGRGRHGRRWESPPGNLYATIVWPDPRGAWPPSVLAAVQLAVAEAVTAAGGPDARVKWPNDGLISGKKWIGALAERSGERMFVGLGANLIEVPETIQGPTTTLRDHWPGWPGAGIAGRRILEAALEVLREGPEAVPRRLTRWRVRDALAIGERVRVDTPSGSLEGEYHGVSTEGGLRLRTDGGLVELTVGEAYRLRGESGTPYRERGGGG